MRLYPHQHAAVDWLVERDKSGELGSGLFDEQGLGKTIEAIVAARELAAVPVLVLCPTVVLWNWRREISKWWPQASGFVVQTGRDRIPEGVDVVVASHGMLLRDSIRAQLLGRSWGVCIVDEAHCFRNWSAKRTRVLYDHGGVTDGCQRVWLLTGTPMPNNASELWSMLYATAPERITLGESVLPLKRTAFRDRFCRTTWTRYGDGVKIIGNKNVDELRDRLKGFALRRLKRDVLRDLPDIRFEEVTLRPEIPLAQIDALSAELAGRYAGDPIAAFEELRDTEEFAKFRRLCGLAKAGAVAELVTMDLDGGLDKVVIFAHHRGVVDVLERSLRGYGVVTITGDTSARERTERVAAFQNGSPRVAVCQIVAGGVGITLTAASEVIMAELSWSPGENAQAADRCHRIGQKDSVRVRFVSLAGTIDEAITSTLRVKTRMIREVLEP
jgi:SWI/SNF-related matrix-associated actin-dependent regulator 1 of chromatin subfamily A